MSASTLSLTIMMNLHSSHMLFNKIGAFTKKERLVTSKK